MKTDATTEDATGGAGRGGRMRRAGITWIWVDLASCAMLLVAGAIGFGIALRKAALPTLDLHLTLDGRHALVFQSDLPYVPNEPPQPTYTPDTARHEFQIIYSTPLDDQV